MVSRDKFIGRRKWRGKQTRNDARKDIWLNEEVMKHSQNVYQRKKWEKN